MATTTLHASVACPNQACRCAIPLGCVADKDCCRSPEDWERRELVCWRCGTRFELVVENLSLWPVISNRPLPESA